MNSVPCERICSNIGLIIDDRRTRLDKSSMLDYISENLAYFQISQ